jgi:hypothetical protein
MPNRIGHAPDCGCLTSWQGYKLGCQQKPLL